MPQQPTRRRLRRRSTNNDTDTTDFLTRSPIQLTAPLETEQNPHHTSEQPPINLPNSTITKLDLDLIRDAKLVL